MKAIAGIEIVDATTYETPSGGEIVIGRCVKERNHLMVFAHIDINEALDLAKALQDAVLKYSNPEGEA